MNMNISVSLDKMVNIVNAAAFAADSFDPIKGVNIYSDVTDRDLNSSDPIVVILAALADTADDTLGNDDIDDYRTANAARFTNVMWSAVDTVMMTDDIGNLIIAMLSDLAGVANDGDRLKKAIIDGFVLDADTWIRRVRNVVKGVTK